MRSLVSNMSFALRPKSNQASSILEERTTAFSLSLKSKYHNSTPTHTHRRVHAHTNGRKREGRSPACQIIAPSNERSSVRAHFLHKIPRLFPHHSSPRTTKGRQYLPFQQRQRCRISWPHTLDNARSQGGNHNLLAVSARTQERLPEVMSKYTS